MTVDAMERYRRAQDGFDAVLAAVPDDRWDAPSACAQWTVRDVAGHVIWGQEQLRHWATGQEYAVTTGAPGAPHPGELAGGDPLATWRRGRAAAVESLTEEALARTIRLPGLGERPLSAMVTTAGHRPPRPHLGHRPRPRRSTFASIPSLIAAAHSPGRATTSSVRPASSARS